MGSKTVQEDNSDAFTRAYRLAIEQGCWNDAFPIWKERADTGHIRSAFYTGVCYDQGLGVIRNLSKAFGYYLMAAESGHAESAHNLYIMYRDGVGTKKISMRDYDG